MTQERVSPTKVVKAAREAFHKGFTKNVQNRLKALKNFKKFLEENKGVIVEAMAKDLRKHHEEARMEQCIVLNHLQYLINNLKRWVGRKRVTKRLVDLFDGIYVYNDPYGVVLIMGAWNFPLLTLAPAAGAIAAGNCVVIKPSHNSQAFSEILLEILPNYLDPQCYPVFIGDIDDTNSLLQERFDYIYYTGSSTVGKIVHLAANKYLTPVTLELGGKNPVYIDPSADLKLAATRVMWGKCFSSGQVCIAPDYVLCTKSVEEEFIKHARNALIKFYDSDWKCCPIVNDHHFKRLHRLLSGLNIAIGGKTDPLENFIEPTVATGVTPSDSIMHEEIFGPILPIITVNNFKEAVSFINEREKPLALYVFTRDSKVKDYFLENTSSGGLAVNDTIMQLMVESLPFGGVGLSGIGRYKGDDSFDTFVHKKSVLVKNTNKILEKINDLRYPPFSKRKTDAVAFLMKSRAGISWFWVYYVSVFVLGFVLGFLVFYYCV